MNSKGKNQNYSLLNHLRGENKITEEFEILLSALTLEEVIAVKLELASKCFGFKLYGLPIFKSVKEIVNDALLKFALSASRSKKEAAGMLGMSPKDLRTYLKKYKTESFFEKKHEKA